VVDVQDGHVSTSDRVEDAVTLVINPTDLEEGSRGDRRVQERRIAQGFGALDQLCDELLRTRWIIACDPLADRRD
jgi:hypothetical protein